MTHIVVDGENAKLLREAVAAGMPPSGKVTVTYPWKAVRLSVTVPGHSRRIFEMNSHDLSLTREAERCSTKVTLPLSDNRIRGTWQRWTWKGGNIGKPLSLQIEDKKQAERNIIAMALNINRILETLPGHQPSNMPQFIVDEAVGRSFAASYGASQRFPSSSPHGPGG